MSRVANRPVKIVPHYGLNPPIERTGRIASSAPCVFEMFALVGIVSVLVVLGCKVSVPKRACNIFAQRPIQPHELSQVVFVIGEFSAGGLYLVLVVHKERLKGAMAGSSPELEGGLQW